MLVIPAIDLMDGRCVRLYRGSFDQVTTYSDDPAGIARRWEDAGAEWLHVVDLDGARRGQPQQLEAVRRIRESIQARIELGGGIRDAAALRQALEVADRVVLGTAAIRQPKLIGDAVADFGDRVAVGIDARDGLVAVDGWEAATTEPATEVASRMRELGAKTIIFTDIGVDGTLAGPNFKALQAMRTVPDVQLIASGGVASIGHLRQLARLGVDGCIIGKALYEGTIDLTRALHEVDDAGERYEW
ncbi:MAG: 1-(5-phosphoribosyl)-5-[(5-phosphoribosylamino)methylideneamino]imidazole-4-carboxamide isomerase [Chloroflexota bacterium]|nr:1-(5-phosphoribosyl)-5-[(5-phosphoribosylamino)methylideneamino]imidazole-4-carboxamide isomerase [Chloroflexota bacterium]